MSIILKMHCAKWKHHVFTRGLQKGRGLNTLFDLRSRPQLQKRCAAQFLSEVKVL